MTRSCFARVLAGTLAAAAIGASSPAPLVAQSTDAPEGFWWSAGVGAGALRFQCDLCATSRDLGPTVEVAAGSWARRGLAVGVDGGFWTFDDDGVREAAYRAGLVAQLYPDPSRGLHFTLGAGWIGWRADEFRYDALRVGVGAGWDVAAVGRFVLGNALTLEGAAFGGLSNGDRRVVDAAGLSMVRWQVFVKRR